MAASDKSQVVQPADKARATDTVVAHIEKQFGKGAIMRLGEASSRMAVETIPTGAIGLDIALGVGGVPRGRVVEIFGPEASGKTTLVQHIIAEAQRTGGVCAIIDAEHALDPEYARKLGVDVDNLFISQPDSGEQALEIAEALVRSAAFDVVAIDSVAALVPRAELEGEMGESHMGLQARLMSQGAAQADGCHKPQPDSADLHQPAAREDRRHDRQPRDHTGRSGAQVLCVGAAGHSPYRLHQAWH